MATHNFTPLLGKRIRVTQVNDDGTVGLFYITTNGFITVTLAAEIEAGIEIIQRNAYGQLCINEKRNPNFKRLNVSMELCGVNPSLLSYMTNAKPYADYSGDIAGFTLPEGEIVGAFALEVWTGLSGALNDTRANGYMLLPFVGKGNLEDIKVDGTNQVTFNFKDAATRGGNKWGRGPYLVVAGTGAASEVQTLTITGIPTGGSFTLGYNGQVTAPIAYNATAAQVQAALQLLPNIGSNLGNVTVSGGPGPATPYVVTFGGQLANTNVTQLTTANTFTGGTTPTIAATTTTGGNAAPASVLPTAIDPFDHFLLIDTSVSAPIVDLQPSQVGIS